MAKVPNFEGFRRFLDEAEALCGQKQIVAERIGIKPAHYSKLYKGEGYTLNVTNCLKLAALIGRTPSEVLRAAGKGAFADLLEHAYGQPRYEPMPGGALGQEMIKRWSAMDQGQREALLIVMRPMPTQPTSAKERETPKKVGRTARRG